MGLISPIAVSTPEELNWVPGTARVAPDGKPVWLAKAPAKVNLFLHITARRDDGYHELQTLFEFIELADELQFSLRKDNQIVLQTTFDDIDAEQNLVVKAARALQQATGYSGGCRIALEKNIPSGAGLGGGSSDAATTLVVLNRLWQTGLSRQALLDIATPLGADVPVFVNGHACWAEGIGERMQAVDLSPGWYVLVYPGVHIATADIFGDPQLTRNCSTITIADFKQSRVGNVCEEVAFRRFPAVAKVHEMLQECAREVQAGSPANPIGSAGSELAPLVRMTGTGSCVFARCNSREQASNLYTKVLAAMPDMGLSSPPGCPDSPDLSVWLAAGCQGSPLYSEHSQSDSADLSGEDRN